MRPRIDIADPHTAAGAHMLGTSGERAWLDPEDLCYQRSKVTLKSSAFRQDSADDETVNVLRLQEGLRREAGLPGFSHEISQTGLSHPKTREPGTYESNSMHRTFLWPFEQLFDCVYKARVLASSRSFPRGVALIF
jgi:hypothetical protein